MFNTLALKIGLRYTRAKKRNHFISFISLSSLLGIALGVMVLIVVLSVMNGFDYQIRSHIFDMASQVNVLGRKTGIKDWKAVSNTALKLPAVQAAAPFVSGQGMLTHQGQVAPIYLKGVLPKQEQTVLHLSDKMIAGHFNALTAGTFGVVLGQGLANKLNVDIGDKVTLVVPTANLSPIGMQPRYKRFTVVGVFHVGHGFGFDTSWAFLNMQDAQALLKLPNVVTGVQLRLNDLYQANHVTRQLSRQLSSHFMVTNWTLQYGNFFRAIAMEKTMMFIILLLIVAVAVFNLVSSLVMIVTDKQADIAILRTLGASPRMILRIFMTQGLIVGVVGTALGVLSGVWLAWHATSIVDQVQHLLHIQLISSDVYFVNFLPSRLHWHDVMQVSLFSLGLSFIATLYPAWRASRVQPAEALRYE